MKLAVVLEAGPGPDSLAHALKVQDLLLDRRGRALDSIRLAVPRLFRSACIEAVAEEPDALVVAAGEKAARRAGQIAYEHGMPILFLPGIHPPHWAESLWGPLSLEETVASLIHGRLNFVRLSAGLAEGQIFFGNAGCGLIPQVAQLHDEFIQAETFPEAMRALSRAAYAAKKFVHPSAILRCAHSSPLQARGAIISVQSLDQSKPHAFSCRIWRTDGPLAYLGSLSRAVRGVDWTQGGHPEDFQCSELTVDAGKTSIFVLDQDPIEFHGPVDFQLAKDSIRSYAFLRSEAKSGGARLGWEYARSARGATGTSELLRRFEHWDE